MTLSAPVTPHGVTTSPRIACTPGSRSHDPPAAAPGHVLLLGGSVLGVVFLLIARHGPRGGGLLGSRVLALVVTAGLAPLMWRLSTPATLGTSGELT